MFIGERAHLLTIDDEHTNKLIVLEHRDAKKRDQALKEAGEIDPRWSALPHGCFGGFGKLGPNKRCARFAQLPQCFTSYAVNFRIEAAPILRENAYARAIEGHLRNLPALEL
jgi:hypothetical protein